MYKEALAEKRGTLISVGTLRTLIAFTMGKFDRLIMLDLSETIIEFNREHLRAIEEIAKEGSLEDQRFRYREKYAVYLEPLESNKPKDFTYYWEDDEKWGKIVNALKDRRINVIRGNLTNIDGIWRLISVMDAINSGLTVDVSNVCQYVDERKDFAKALEKLQLTSPDDVSAIVTTHVYCKPSSRYDSAIKGRLGKVDWDYYFFENIGDYIRSLKK